MGDENYRILLIEDCSRGMSKIYADFAFSNFNNLLINLVSNIADVEHRLKTDSFAAIILAQNLPHYEGTSLVNHIQKLAAGIPLIVYLDSQDQQRIQDVKRSEVDKIFYDQTTNLQEVEDICRRSENRREKRAKKRVLAPNSTQFSTPVTPLASTASADQTSAVDAVDVINERLELQNEIKKHKEALSRVRSESQSQREVAEKAREEASRLKDEAEKARLEAEQIKQKIEELRLENEAKARLEEQNRQNVEQVSAEVGKEKDELSSRLNTLVQERDKLADSLNSFAGEVASKDELIARLQEEIDRLNYEKDRQIAGLQEEISRLNNAKNDTVAGLQEQIRQLSLGMEQLKSENNELLRRYEDSENKKNISVQDAQEALSNFKRLEASTSELRQRLDDTVVKLESISRERDAALERQHELQSQTQAVSDDYQKLRAIEAGLRREKAETENSASELAKKLEGSQSMIANLNKVVESLETRCEELEAGQAALIEAEHVGIQREREAREEAERELEGLRASMVDIASIESERAKLEQLLAEGQNQEAELAREKVAELEGVISHERENNNKLQQQLNGVKGQLESKSMEWSTLTANNERYEHQLAQQQAERRELEAELQDYKEQKTELQRLVNSLEQDKQRAAALETELEQARGESGSLEESRAKLEAELEALRAELEQDKQRAAALETELEQTRGESGSLEESRAKLEAELEALRVELEQDKQRAAALETELEQTRGESGSLEESRAKLEAELEALRAELEQDKQRAAALETELEQARGESGSLEESRAKLEAELEALRTELEQGQKGAEQFKLEADSLNGEFAKVRADYERNLINSDKLKRESAQVSTQLGNLRADYERVQQESEKSIQELTLQLNTEKENNQRYFDKIASLEAKITGLTEENNSIKVEKQEIMESYTNKSEAIQERLSETENMLKDCEWKLENEISLKDMAFERIMELGVFEDQVGKLDLELAAKEDELKNLGKTLAVQREEIAALKESEATLKDRVQLESLAKEMKTDKLSTELEQMRTEYAKLKEKTEADREQVVNNAREVQDRLKEAHSKLKNAQWEVGELEKKNAALHERVGELEGELAQAGDLHSELDDFKDMLDRAEKRLMQLSSENDELRVKLEGYSGMAQKLCELEQKAELADKVALEIEQLSQALKEEQIEHRRLDVELHRAHERESHLEELKRSNKELGWELMKARSLIGEYMAKEDERALAGVVDSSQLETLRRELKEKEEAIAEIVREKEEFARSQQLKVAELTELYEKAQTERLELLERLGRK